MPYCSYCGKPYHENSLFCQHCGKKIEHPATSPTGQVSQPSNASISRTVYPWGDVIAWLPSELRHQIYYNEAREFRENKRASTGVEIGGKGFIIATSRRIIFVTRLGVFSKSYSVEYSVNIEDVTGVSQGRYILNHKLIILEKSGRKRQFIDPKIYQMVSIVNKLITERYAEMEAERERERTIVSHMITSQPQQQVATHETIVREIVKIPCPYCRNLNDILSSKCQFCGATLHKT